MTENELLRVELMMWKAIAASRARHNADMSEFFDTICEVAIFWRSHVEGDAEYPPELAAKIAALQPTTGDVK